ncbi:MAG: hypothetical protein ACREJC_13680, partial [Tepidisphaeraceae bacterium]
LVHADQPDEKALLDSACAYVAAAGKFKAAVKDKFGEEAAAMFASNMRFSPLDSMTKLIEEKGATAPESAEGNVVSFALVPDTDDVMILEKTASGWQVSAGRMLENWTPEQRAERGEMMHQAAAALDSVTADLNAGRFASPAELGEALKQIFQRG